MGSRNESDNPGHLDRASSDPGRAINETSSRDPLGNADQWARERSRRVPLALGLSGHQSDAVTNLDQNRALVFGEVAEEYARWRPTYPDQAVAWLARDARTVVDLGAGTGQLTGALLDRGVTVHAVERDPRMLSVLGTQFPAAHRHESGADQIPLPDHSVDAVLSADAWHWFPVEATIAEVRRVLRPGGWPDSSGTR